MPETGTWQKLTLSTTEEAFTTSATIDLFTKALSNATKSSSVTLDLNDIVTTAEDNVLTAWIMLSPVDLQGKAVSVSVKSAEKEYVATFTPTKAYVAGKAYSVSATAEQSKFLNGKFKVSDNKYVTFAMGNLQYDIQNSKYQLAENQWTYLNTATKNTQNYFEKGTDDNRQYGQSIRY